jgi:BirA family transcriptional regulator, biotin operon repressor / biotin---[acetyl-CoA-carboxylase] ligase
VTDATWLRTLSDWGRSSGRNLALHGSIGSTHRAGLELLAGGAPPVAPTWTFAYEQSRGEGRRGRTWVSPPGLGVYASCVLGLSREAVGLLPVAIGVALCGGLSGLGVSCRLKWPNDLLLEGDKLGGILVQARGFGPAVGVVASFGVNLGHRRQDLPRADATSLALWAASGGALPEVTLAGLSILLAEEVEGWLTDRLADPGRHPELLAKYRHLSAHKLGDRLTVTTGDKVLEGEFAGFAMSGQLRLATSEGELLVGAGEIGP